jgi:nitrite reductase/ring-hydroxylating ferredoxin subunit
VKYVVASADEIPPGGRKIVSVAGRSIGIFNLDGEFFALRNRCPHQAGALCEGTLWGVLRADVPGVFDYSPSREILTCPWHGWEFHVRTGQSWCEPRRLRVRRFEVTVEDGKTLVANPDASADPHAAANPDGAANPERAANAANPERAANPEPVAYPGAAAIPELEGNPKAAASPLAATDTSPPAADAGAAAGSPADADVPAPGLVRGPYLVETYPVSIEGTYLVVEMKGA